VVEIEYLERSPPAEREPWRFFQGCRLIEKKGVPTTLRAFVAIAERYPEARLRIGGDGPLRGALEAEAAELGIGDRVEFLGFLRQRKLRNQFQEAHFFMHPSQTGADGDREGVPNAMLEAMATGLPVLATRHGGIVEAVEDGVSGILAEEKDWRSLAEGALRLMADSEAYRRMSSAAREAVEKNFESSASIATLEGYYEEAMEIFGRD
jgi:colanic acid/amylovoran biosynthesis glycosyltransferase